jgi:ribosomal protein S27AE
VTGAAPSQSSRRGALAWRDCPACGNASFLAQAPETTISAATWSWCCGSCGFRERGHPAQGSSGIGRVGNDMAVLDHAPTSRRLMPWAYGQRAVLVIGAAP